jgi:putative membrane protein
MKLKKITLFTLVLYIFTTWYSLLAPRFDLPKIPNILYISSFASFGFSLLHAGKREGWKRAFFFLFLVFVISILFESVGVMTGRVYGHYHYSDKLGYKLFGLVPAIIPIAWYMMMYPAFVIADILTPKTWSPAKRILPLAAIGGLVMTAWDVVMDPLMSRGGNWIWERGGAYYDIPLQNFWGWWLTVFVIFVLYLWLGKRKTLKSSPAFDRLALISYVTTGSANIYIALRTDFGGAALAGFFAMIPWAMMAWFKTKE